MATVAFAALLCVLSFYTSGGLELGTSTNTELALTLGSGVVLAAAALALRAGTSRFGLWPSLLLLGFALLSAISIVWSVQPDGSWRDAARLLAYAAVFAAAVVLAKLAPRRWPALLGGIALGSAIVCGYALLAKSLPNHFTEANRYARLYEPYGYWNALGLTAALGAICCMWLGARRAGHAVITALAYPAMGVLLLTLLLAYSRGALLALVVGLVVWFAVVPLRLRGAAVLLAGAVTAGAIAAWDFSNHSLSSDGVPIADSTSAGHELGALVLAMTVLLSVVGVAVVFATGRRPPPRELRRRAGTALLVLLAVGIVGFAGALAVSHRGFAGSVSHAYNKLTDTHAKVPNTPGRLTAIASVRAQYWDEALKVFKAHPALGAGAQGYEVARLRYRTGPLPVKHAHGFIVQTLSDLGIVGLLAALALLASWMAAAGRA
ncbi:MAG TPA: O-antigen ligase family protein, partial [Solirubrobacteraceae bacterium]